MIYQDDLIVTLLEALKHARNQMQRTGFAFEMDDVLGKDGYRSIDAAIAKAEGVANHERVG